MPPSFRCTIFKWRPNNSKLMRTIGGAKTIGPLLIGLGLPIEIAPLRSSSNDILNLASVAAFSSEVIDYKNKKKN